jgi:hypothetical protein
MAIPLRKLTSPDLKSSSSSHHHPRDSLDSETSAILSYALGKKEGLDTDDEDDVDESARGSTTLDDDEDDFFKENDPLTSDYEPFPLKKVAPVALELNLNLEIAEISNNLLLNFGSVFISLGGCFNWIFVKGIF